MDGKTAEIRYKQWIQLWSSSGLSKRDYCRQNGIGEKKLYYLLPTSNSQHNCGVERAAGIIRKAVQVCRRLRFQQGMKADDHRS